MARCILLGFWHPKDDSLHMLDLTLPNVLLQIPPAACQQSGWQPVRQPVKSSKLFSDAITPLCQAMHGHMSSALLMYI